MPSHVPQKHKIIHPKREGVEEKKDDLEHDRLPLSPRRSQSQENDEQERMYGFQAQVQKFAKVIIGTCGTAMEAATVFVQGQTCSPPWPNSNPCSPQQQRSPEPLSIADELRLLAAREGRPFPEPIHPRAQDIPKFLGEEAVHSFEDDNISAISAHTLEEMAVNGIMHPVSQRFMMQQQQQKMQQQMYPGISHSDSQTNRKDRRQHMNLA